MRSVLSRFTPERAVRGLLFVPDFLPYVAVRLTSRRRLLYPRNKSGQVWTRMNGDGILHITGRIKEIIIRNGVNLSARHIEEVLLSVPGVSAAAVVGIPHPQQGEVPAAMAVSDRTEAE